MKKINPFFLLTSIFIISLFFSSCRGSCSCSKKLECSTLTAKQNTDSVTLEKRMYCSVIDSQSDVTFQDSLKTFYLRHVEDNTTLTRKDSTVSFESTKKMSPNKTGPFEKTGFTCLCAK